LQPFVKLVESAFSQRKEGRDLRKAKRRKEA
jgi:hypothetical protein